MTRDKSKFKPIKISKTDEEELSNCLQHYNMWNEDNENRQTRKNGWNDITDAYYGKLPEDWPYISKVVDPVLRTTIVEKNARLMNAKLRGRLTPREGGDLLSARLNNTLLDFQWDNANHGGSMLEKWACSEQDTRLYATKFAKIPWLHEVDSEGNVLFDGNEFIPKDIRDCGMDPNCEHLRSAKWFQEREWLTEEDLSRVSEADGKPLYPGLKELKDKINENKSDRRDTRRGNRILQNKGLTDRMGDDEAFPVLEIVTEYRPDRFITFSPLHKVILRDIPNPYKHNKIPFIQLRYYMIQGDPLGESEAESVLPLWRAIQACLDGYMDGMNMRLRPPKMVLDGKARIETIIQAPEALWIVDQVDAVTEHQTGGESDRTFQTVYSALKSAFNTAMGDMSQGVSNVDPLARQKTATEIKESTKQQNSRDQKNQTSISEAIQDMMSMWLSNNQQFLFADKGKQEYILEIVGTELFNYFQRAGLDGMELAPEAMQAIGDIIAQTGGNMSDDDMMQMVEAGKTPKFPIIKNPKEKDPSKLEITPKMRMNDMGDGAQLSLVPEDLNGTFNYVPDVKSMAAGADAELQNALQRAIDQLTTNPTVLQLLQLEGVQPSMKELMVDSLTGLGLQDAERYFPAAKQQQIPGATGAGGGSELPLQAGGLPADISATLAAGANPNSPQPQGLPNTGQVSGGSVPASGQGGGLQTSPQAF
ncbi:MAG: hypothetical protein M0P59_13435 [Gallionella sp.]|jgi:hypothetical protein|nr:hypothetical protein [Gallionella sp.]